MNPDRFNDEELERLGVDPDDPSLHLEELLNAPTPTCWRYLEGDDRQERWDDLRTWVEWLVGRFALDHKTIPPCWWRHGALTEELTALQDAWNVAYADTNSAAGPADWMAIFAHTRERLRSWATRSNCSLSDHRGDQHATWPDDRADWIEHLEAERL